MKKKKFLLFPLIFLLLISNIFIFISCSSSKSKVSLAGISATTQIKEEKQSKIKPMAAHMFLDDEEVEIPKEKEDDGQEQEEPNLSIGSDYTIIYKTDTVLYFTINLINPENYYIMDFRLYSEDEDILIQQGTKQNKINDKNMYIRWDEAYTRSGNQEATFILTLPNAEISPTKIKILDMYYSDRTDGSNKTAINMNNKETYTVYKVEELKIVERNNTIDGFLFKLNPGDGEIISVKINETEYKIDENEYYKIPSGKLEILYKYTTEKGEFNRKYEENIDVLKIERTDRNKDVLIGYGENCSSLSLYYKISGTDFTEIEVLTEIKYEIKHYDNFIYIFFSQEVSDEELMNLKIKIVNTEISVKDLKKNE